MTAETKLGTPERRLADFLDGLERDVSSGSRSLTSVLAQVYLAGVDHGIARGRVLEQQHDYLHAMSVLDQEDP